MLYFLAWVAFIVVIVAAVPVGVWLEKRKMAPKPIMEEPVEEAEAEVEEIIDEVPEETDLERQLRRLKIVSENLSQEEMFAHAQATLELATMLHSENRLEDANRALAILSQQPGIGGHYLTRALVKHSVVLRALGQMDDFQVCEARLAEVYGDLKLSSPEAASEMLEELLPEETELLSKL